MVKLLRKYVYPKCLLPGVYRPPPNQFQLLWELRRLKDPEEVEEAEATVDGDDNDTEPATGVAVASRSGPGADEEVDSSREEEAVDGPTPEDKRGQYFLQLVTLLRQLWKLTLSHVHQDELCAAVKVAVTYPANLETSDLRHLLAKLLLRDAAYEAASQVYESINRDYPRDANAFVSALSVASLARRLGNNQKACDTFQSVTPPPSHLVIHLLLLMSGMYYTVG